FSTPLIRNLKENFKDAPLTYICNRRAESLVKDNIFLDKVLVFEKDEWRAQARQSKFEFLRKFFSFLGEVKREKFDVMFDLSMNSQYGFFFKMAGIPKRIGYNFKDRGRFLTHKLELTQGYSESHVTDYYLELLKFLNITPKKYPFDLFLKDDILKAAEELLRTNLLDKDSFLVAVCPGSGDSWQETAYFKRWPQEYFLEVCQWLQTGLGAKIILFGSKVEQSICDYIYNGLSDKPLNLCARVNLEEFAGLLSFSKLVLTNDGGPFHMAQALKKKTVVFYGPVDEKVYGAYPDRKNITLFAGDLPCRPCYKGFKFPSCSLDKKCLRDITPQEVIPAIKQLIILEDNNKIN
ncbi:MAG: glycosyltransferase family 9 protein, partial [Candidatus Omnitrophica bacterium]|nr:glycosyltransferase family 9 protein [Candidatus Omnitrophota bacterium]